jgi:hypothetical protein
LIERRLIEAKGPGCAEMLEKSPFFEEVFSTEWRDQAIKQVRRAAGAT